MPAAIDPAKTLKPYQFHRVELETKGKEALGDCPFCGREGKFSLNLETTRWKCWGCRVGSEKGGGNLFTFLRVVWERSEGLASQKELDDLAANRGLLSSATLLRWGVRKSLLTGEWLIPGFNSTGTINQLYRYVRNRETGKYRLYATPTLHQCLFGIDRFNPKRKQTYLCEGPWDAMALEELLLRVKEGEEGVYTATGNSNLSLGAKSNVLAVPGCTTFFDGWANLFQDQKVCLLFDNDYPKVQEQITSPPAGTEGMKRVANLILSSQSPPEEVSYLHWGDEGYCSELPPGYDVRDFLTKGADGLTDRVNRLTDLIDRMAKVPGEWVTGAKGSIGSSSSKAQELPCLPCVQWKALTNSWRKAVKWTDGMDRALSVMLAAITSTRAVGDQLWIKIIGPAACGKSTLCEAISVSKKYVLAKSTIRGFHSGFQPDREGREDASLLAQLKDKTLVTKDGDTLLQSPNVQQILAEARDVYDRVSRTHYRNKQSRDYEGINMTWILCGTSSLRALDSSELGERFLDCVIVEDIDEDEEDDIAMRVARRAARDMSYEANGTPETRDGPEYVQAKQLTGGYITYLRENATHLLSEVEEPEETLRLLSRLAKFVAFMRARPSAKQEEKAEREMSYRLTSQLVRLAKCLAVVLNKQSIDDPIVLKRVKKVAMDTARGRVRNLCKYLYRCGEAGADTKALAIWTGETEDKERTLLRFLVKIGAVEYFIAPKAKGLAGQSKWKLSRRLSTLYAEVVDEDL